MGSSPATRMEQAHSDGGPESARQAVHAKANVGIWRGGN
jgi:hypothetical protein